jgi:hypothetical protein
MRILLGSIAMVDEGEEPGITSPDYVVFRPRSGTVHHRWFYHWLRSPDGAAFIRTLTRGAVRERLLFRRLARAFIELPTYEAQLRFGEEMAWVQRAQAAAREQSGALIRLPAKYLLAAFQRGRSIWPSRLLGDLCDLLPAKSIQTNGDSEVRAVTTACLSETGFLPDGIKIAKMAGSDAASSTLSAGEILVARSNTPDLVGRASLFPGASGRIVASDLTFRLRTKTELSPAFLAGYLSFLYSSGHWKERAGGASGSMKKITGRQVLAETIPLPEAAVQETVAGALAGRMASVIRLRSALKEERDVLARSLPTALLRRAFGGEL